MLQAEVKQSAQAHIKVGVLEAAAAAAQEREAALQGDLRCVKAQLADALYELDGAQQALQTSRTYVAALHRPALPGF